MVDIDNRIQQLQKLLLQDERSEDSINNDDSSSNRMITWSWVAKQLVKVLLNHSEGITFSIIVSELKRIKETESKDLISKQLKEQFVSRDNLPSTGSYFQRNDIPFDIIIDSIVISTSELSLKPQQQKNNSNDTDNSQSQYILILSNHKDTKKTIPVYLHPKYNYYYQTLIKDGTRIKLTGIKVHFPTNPQDKLFGKLVILSPENMCIVYDDQEQDLPIKVMCSDNYYNVDRYRDPDPLKSKHLEEDTNMMLDNNHSHQNDHTSTTTTTTTTTTMTTTNPSYSSLFILKVDSIDENAVKVTTESKWNNLVPYDRQSIDPFLLKQSVYLSDPNSVQFSQLGSNQSRQPLCIQLVFWDSLCQTTKLINPKDILILQNLFFNQQKSDLNRMVFEFTLESTIIIIPNLSKENLNNNRYFSKIEQSNLDMIYYSKQLKLFDLVIGMVNITLVARIVHVGKNTNMRIPIILMDDTEVPVLLLLIDEMVGLIQNLRIGQLCYFENLYLLEIDGKKRLCTHPNSFIQPLSSMQGVINSYFLHGPPLQSSEQLETRTNTIVKASITECILYDELPLYAYHKPCKRLLANSKVAPGQLECAHCQSIVQPIETEKLFHLSFQLELVLDKDRDRDRDGKKEVCSIVASASHPILNRQILQIDEESFSKLSPTSKSQCLNKILNTFYLFSISTVKIDGISQSI
ncbi:hypothetical protein DFA_06975 [Cavenderia fasciculata]|uniref:Uncharacterized protein n=1 Tax=Cavenderia fasciculata TaxID=261658 RepID=F4PX69_CACFS|nr:uncharacterized protein DFA_06975 [Cavenderia fasciculata]EGG19872.1 hypothetical protein DFA_06975 [Cavenderia fasciculata]|eukprot:XP_004358218.1 hypothetical protein DFA_06975 [Cavenderia fasciculata]